MSKQSASILGLLLVISTVSPLPKAYAVLGGKGVDVDQDAQALQADSHTQTKSAKYTVHEIVTGGTKIREYQSVDGDIIGVAWNGLSPPDMSKLLDADHTSVYENEKKTRSDELKKNPKHRLTRHHKIVTPTFVMESGGHQRNLQGRAYDPKLCEKAGVSPDEIK